MSIKQLGSLFLALANTQNPTGQNEAASNLGETFGLLGQNQEALNNKIDGNHSQFLAFKADSVAAINKNTTDIVNLATAVKENADKAATGMATFSNEVKTKQEKDRSDIVALQDHNKSWRPVDIYNTVISTLTGAGLALSVGGALAMAGNKPRTTSTP